MVRIETTGCGEHCAVVLRYGDGDRGVKHALNCQEKNSAIRCLKDLAIPTRRKGSGSHTRQPMGQIDNSSLRKFEQICIKTPVPEQIPGACVCKDWAYTVVENARAADIVKPLNGSTGVHLLAPRFPMPPDVRPLAHTGPGPSPSRRASSISQSRPTSSHAQVLSAQVGPSSSQARRGSPSPSVRSKPAPSRSSSGDSSRSSSSSTTPSSQRSKPAPSRSSSGDSSMSSNSSASPGSHPH